jgi:hypothetical protein
VLFRHIKQRKWADSGCKRDAEKDTWMKDRERNRKLGKKLIMSNYVTLSPHKILFRQLNKSGGDE